jgi:hypothetical protein
VIGEKPGRDAVMATMLAPPHPRLGRPEDIAALVVFLACDKSAFITGQNICVDGGLLAHQPFAADFRTDIRYSAVRGAAAAAVAGDLRAQPEAVVLAVGGEQRQDRGELFCRTDPARPGGPRERRAGGCRPERRCLPGWRWPCRRLPVSGWGSSGPYRVRGQVAEASGELPESVDVGEGGDQAE